MSSHQRAGNDGGRRHDDWEGDRDHRRYDDREDRDRHRGDHSNDGHRKRYRDPADDRERTVDEIDSVAFSRTGYRGTDAPERRDTYRDRERRQYDDDRGVDPEQYSGPGDDRVDRRRNRREPPPSKTVYVPLLAADTIALIDSVAVGVLEAGVTFEEDLLSQQEKNPHLAFLSGAWTEPPQLWYRWRLFSLLHNDTIKRWRTASFRMSEDGPNWVPPPMPPIPDRFSLQTTGPPPPPPPTRSEVVTTVVEGQPAIGVKHGEGDVTKPLENHPDAPPEPACFKPPTTPPVWQLDQIAAVFAADAGLMYHRMPDEPRGVWRRKLMKAPTLSRRRIGSCMTFALKNAEYAMDLLVVLLESMTEFRVSPESAQRLQMSPPPATELTAMSGTTVSSSPASRPLLAAPDVVRDRIGKLFVLNDILHNVSSVNGNVRSIDAYSTLSLPTSGSTNSALDTAGILRNAKCFIKAIETMFPVLLDALQLSLLYVAGEHLEPPLVKGQTVPQTIRVRLVKGKAAPQAPGGGVAVEPPTTTTPAADGALLQQWCRCIFDLWEEKVLLPAHILREGRQRAPNLFSGGKQ